MFSLIEPSNSDVHLEVKILKAEGHSYSTLGPVESSERTTRL